MIDGLKDVYAFRDSLMSEYPDEQVSVNLLNGSFLTVMFVNSDLGDLPEEEKQEIAANVGKMVPAFFDPEVVDDGILSFAVQKNYLIFNYSSNLDAYSLMLPKEVKLDPRYFPFSKKEVEGEYYIMVEVEREEIFKKYNPLFVKYDYSGNGYSWEGHINQILEKINPGLLDHLEFDSEAGLFTVKTDSERVLERFMILSSIFSDLSVLEKYIIEADRERIDD
ncbi:MAG: Imm51 family immunity protein [Bacteroidota bacterium]